MAMSTIEIDADTIEIAIEDYENGRGAPHLNDHFCAVAYPLETPTACHLALVDVRQAWLKALSNHLDKTDALDRVMNAESNVRAVMNGFDNLPVPPMLRKACWEDQDDVTF